MWLLNFSGGGGGDADSSAAIRTVGDHPFLPLNNGNAPEPSCYIFISSGGRRLRRCRVAAFLTSLAFVAVNLTLAWLLLSYYSGDGGGSATMSMGWRAEQDTIEEILASRNVSASKLIEDAKKVPQLQHPPDDCHGFHYLKIHCNSVLGVEGSCSNSKFEICDLGLLDQVAKMNNQQQQQQQKMQERVAYFIGGARDRVLERNFHLATQLKLHVYHHHHQSEDVPSNSTTATFPNIKAESAAQKVNEFESAIATNTLTSNLTTRPTYSQLGGSRENFSFEIGVLTDCHRHGLKDLVDENGDIDRVEIFKFEIDNSRGVGKPGRNNTTEATSPPSPPLLDVLLSITPGVDYCQLVVRMEFATFRQLRDLVAQLNSAEFYPFAASYHHYERHREVRAVTMAINSSSSSNNSSASQPNVEHRSRVHYSLAAMSKSCLGKYGVGQPHAALWTRNEASSALFCETM